MGGVRLNACFTSSVLKIRERYRDLDPPDRSIFSVLPEITGTKPGPTESMDVTMHPWLKQFPWLKQDKLHHNQIRDLFFYVDNCLSIEEFLN